MSGIVGPTFELLVDKTGIQWKLRQIRYPAVSIFGVCYGNGLFVAVTTTGNRVMTSPDGITWTTRTSAADNTWYSVCYSDVVKRFVSVSRPSYTIDAVMVSP